MNENNTAKNAISCAINCRQLCFFCAFLFPLGKILEAPRIFAQYAAGDLLLPAFLQLLLQGGAFALLLYTCSKCEKPILEELRLKISNVGMAILYIACALFFVFASLLPLLDLDKFCYAAFFDTSPTVFSFAPFFLLSAFLCLKNLKAFGRLFDISMLLFIPSFAALIIFSTNACDFSNLLPLFEKPFSATAQTMRHTFSFFYDSTLFLFLLNGYSYQKGDGKKIGGSFAAGAVITLLFLAIFFGVFGAMAGSEHYAFIKISQFFPSLKTTGRIDLIFSYLLTVLLLVYACLPLQLAIQSLTSLFKTKKTLLLSLALNVGLFVFVLFCNNYYNTLYEWISVKLFPIFLVFAYLLPIFVFLTVVCIKRKKDGGRVAVNKSKLKKELENV